MNKTIWLLRLLYRHTAGLTRQEILEAWREEDDHGRPMALSTFYDNRKCLATSYGVGLTLEKGRYRLSYGTPGDEAVVRQLADSGQASDTKAILSQEWLEVLATGLNECRHVLITYASINSGTYDTDLCPYLCHTVNGVCYVVGLSSRHKAIRTFATDRIQAARLRHHSFARPDGFTAEKWFGTSIGAFGGSDLRAEHVVLRPLSAHMAAYLRQRWIHRSQREMPGPEFHLDVAITPDLVGLLLSFGSDICVVAPVSLRRRMAETGRIITDINA